MTTNILVVTPTAAFGDVFRKTLEQSGNYRVHLARAKSEAVVRADEEACSEAFVDFEFGVVWVIDVCQSLRTIHPGINLYILCDDETPSALDSIRPWTLVRKPFYLPDVIKMLENHQTTSSQMNPPADDAPWLKDPSKAAQHLTRITLESSAQAALITRKHDLWAYAGELSQAAAREVAQTVTRNWDGQKGSDLLRFVRLESTKAEHMLYATRIAVDVVLALVFDAETPFSTIRSQAGQLINAFEGVDSEAPLPPKQEKPAKAEAPRYLADMPKEALDDDDDMDIPPITNIITDVPSPNPVPATNASPAIPLSVDQTHRSAPLSRAMSFNREASPATPLNKMSSADQMTTPPNLDELDVTAPSRARRPLTPVAPPQPGELAETRPGPTTEAQRKLKLEPVTAGLYHLTYACLLVPRFSTHYLAGDIFEMLSAWMPSICVAFGWRLEHLSVRPEYLQWVVNVPPNTSPGYLMRIVRQQTSEKIFAEFPRLKKENPSGDFWAPGYLIMGGNQPHPAQLVKDYIRETRERQGLEHSVSSR